MPKVGPTGLNGPLRRAGWELSGWRRLAPRAVTLLGHRRARVRGDLLAGVTVAAYLVPQVMAYAGVAGLPPVAGLWAILPALALYALLGSSRLLSVGPLAAGDPGRYATLAAALAVTVGLLCLVARKVRLGFLADLLSRSVDTTGAEFFPQLCSFAAQLADAHTPTVLLSAVVLVFLFTVPKHVPGPLLAFVLATATVIVFDLDDRYSVKVIGEIPSGLRAFAWPDLSELPRLVLPALGVLIVAYTDFILTARVPR
jgi:sulfate permease, SulP family